MTTATKRRPANSDPRNRTLDNIREAAHSIEKWAMVAKKTDAADSKEITGWLKNDVKELQRLIEQLERME